MNMAFDLDKAPEPTRFLVIQTKHILGSFNRHFVGKPRPVADVKFLDELIARLREVHRELGELDSAGELTALVSQRIQMLEGERGHICAAAAQYPLQDRASFFAARINDQFSLYRTHFAGRPRQSRRIGLLRRIIASLEGLLEEMADPAFDALENREQHARNIELVNGELVKLRSELEQIEEGQAAVPIDERIRALAAAANSEFSDYRAHFLGRDRTARDRELLGAICDRLGELELQMAEIARDSGDSVNETNRRLLLRNLNVYEEEYVAVANQLRTWRLVDLIRSGQALRDEIAAADASPDEKRSALGHLEALLREPILRRLAPLDS